MSLKIPEKDFSALTEAEWKEGFINNIRISQGESFAVLMCTINSSDIKQRELLYKIVFENPKNVKSWLTYVNYVIQHFPNSKIKIPRLLSLAVRITDAKTHYHSKDFVDLHLLNASWQSSKKAISDAYSSMYSKGIGTNFASFFDAWSSWLLREGEQTEAISVLKKGIDSKAEPINILLTKHHDYLLKCDQEVSLKTGPSNKRTSLSDDDSSTQEEITVAAPPPTQTPQTKKDKTPQTKERRIEVAKELKSSEKSTTQSEVKSSTLRKRPALTGKLLSLGKCQRVSASSKKAVSDQQTDSAQSDDEDTATGPLKHPSTHAINEDDIIDFKRPSRSSCGTGTRLSVVEEDVSITEKISVQAPNDANIGPIKTTDSHKSNTSRKVDDTIEFKSVPSFKDALALAAISSDEDTSEEIALSTLTREEVTKTVKDSDVPVVSQSTALPANKDITDKVAANGNTTKKRVSFLNEAEADLPPRTTAARQREASKSSPSSKEKSPARKRSKTPTKETDSKLEKSFFENKPIVCVNGVGYMELGVLGKGGSASVKKVVSNGGNIYAFKRIEVGSASCGEDDVADEVMESYINEINLLKRFKSSPYIIELIDSEVNMTDMSVSMIMEAGEIDLASCISQQKKLHASNDNKRNDQFCGVVNPYFARMVWEKMLLAVDHIHEQRIVHGDLKPANFVFVKGQLKLIDFGIAKAISNDTTNIYRNALIGTVNYMAPEALTQASNSQIKHGRPSDIWSLGCILYQMIYGKPPFASITNFHQRIAAISSPTTQIIYPELNDENALDTMKLCLHRDINLRASIRGQNGLLEHAYLTMPFSSSTNNVSQTTVVSKKEYVSCGINTNEIVQPIVKNTTITEPKVDMKSVKKIVQWVVREVGGDKNKLDTHDSLDFMCQEAYKVLTSKDGENVVLPTSNKFPIWQDRPIDEVENIDNNKKDSTVKSRLSQHPPKLQLRTNSSPACVNNTNHAPVVKSKPLVTLPVGLQEQIQRQSSTSSQSGIGNGDSIKSSVLVPKDRSKWVRPKGATPEKCDMRSSLERKMEGIRKFLRHDDVDDTTANSFDVGDDSFSFL